VIGWVGGVEVIGPAVDVSAESFFEGLARTGHWAGVGAMV
jgi:hypothetical protein